MREEISDGVNRAASESNCPATVKFQLTREMRYGKIF